MAQQKARWVAAGGVMAVTLVTLYLLVSRAESDRWPQAFVLIASSAVITALLYGRNRPQWALSVVFAVLCALWALTVLSWGYLLVVWFGILIAAGLCRDRRSRERSGNDA